MSDSDTSILSGYAGQMLIVSSLGWATLQLGRRTLPALLPTISDEIGITATEAGLLLTTLSATYAIMQYPSGRFSDQFSRKGPLVVGVGCSVIGCLLLGSAVEYIGLITGVLVVGVGAGVYPTSARALVSDLFVERRGEAFGIHTASGDVGSALAAGVALAALTLATWRGAFLFTAVCLAIIIVLIHVSSRDTYRFGYFSLGLRNTAETLLGVRSVRQLLVAYSLYVIAIEGIIGFLPALLQVEKGLSPAVASAGYATFFIAGIIARPLAGRLSDHMARGAIASVSIFVAASGLLATVYVSTPTTALLAIVVLAFGTKAYPPVMQAYLMDLFPDESAGADLGAMRTIYIGIGSLGPTYVGVVSTHFDYATAFLGLVGCLLVSATIVLFFSPANSA
jgi:MFS family permease